MARLGIEPRLPEYVPGALPLSYLALGYQTKLHILSTHVTLQQVYSLLLVFSTLLILKR
jgi:hypothetical protein